MQDNKCLARQEKGDKYDDMADAQFDAKMVGIGNALGATISASRIRELPKGVRELASLKVMQWFQQPYGRLLL